MSESETRSVFRGVKYELAGVTQEPGNYAVFYGPPSILAGLAVGLITGSVLGGLLGGLFGVFAWFAGIATVDPPYRLTETEYERALDPDDEYLPSMGRLK